MSEEVSNIPTVAAITGQLERNAVCYACGVDTLRTTSDHAPDCPVKIMNDCADEFMRAATYGKSPVEGWDKLFDEIKALIPGEIVVLTGSELRSHKYQREDMFLLDSLPFQHMEMSATDIADRIIAIGGDIVIHHAIHHAKARSSTDDHRLMSLDFEPEAMRLKEYRREEIMACPEISRHELERPRDHPKSPKETMRGNRPKRSKHKRGKRK